MKNSFLIKTICTAHFFILILSVVAEQPMQHKKEVGNYLWGYKICPDVREELRGKTHIRAEGDNKSEIDEILINKWEGYFSKNSDVDNSNISKVTTILLLGYYKVPEGIELLINNLEYQYGDEKSIIHYPARDALANYGEMAIPKIIEAYENGMSGRKANIAFSVLSGILRDDLNAFIKEQQKKMSPESFRRLIDNAGD